MILWWKNGASTFFWTVLREKWSHFFLQPFVSLIIHPAHTGMPFEVRWITDFQHAMVSAKRILSKKRGRSNRPSSVGEDKDAGREKLWAKLVKMAWFVSSAKTTGPSAFRDGIIFFEVPRWPFPPANIAAGCYSLRRMEKIERPESCADHTLFFSAFVLASWSWIVCCRRISYENSSARRAAIGKDRGSSGNYMIHQGPAPALGGACAKHFDIIFSVCNSSGVLEKIWHAAWSSLRDNRDKTQRVISVANMIYQEACARPGRSLCRKFPNNITSVQPWSYHVTW